MRITDRELKQEIIDQLSELPVYYPNRSKTQHVIRCTSCGDSHNQSHAHLSIRINADDDMPMLYRCFRCNDSGMVTPEMLYEWGVKLDHDSLSSLNIYNKKTKKKHKGLFSDTYEEFFTPQLDSEMIYEYKAMYINGRLGTNFTLEDLRQLKVVLSLEEFIKANKIKPDVPMYMRKAIDSNYLGFLATNNNRIMFRNTNKELGEREFRWYNVICNDKNLNPHTFYSIPNSIDLYYTHEINIHIAEGCFDILSIYQNLQQGNKESNYYYASCGSSGLSIMNYLINIGINTGLNVHLYADKDKSDEFHMNYLMRESEVYQWCDKIIIHRNRYPGEKDYGVPKERIKDSYRTVYRK